MKWNRKKKAVVVPAVAVQLLGGLATAGLLFVALRSAPELVRYVRMRRM
jgi:hypothetical protein